MAIRSSPHVLHTCIARISGRRLLHVALCKLTAIKHASEPVALAASHNHVEVLHIPRLARVRNCNSSFKPTNACVVVVAALLFWPARLNDLLFYPSWPISPPLSTPHSQRDRSTIGRGMCVKMQGKETVSYTHLTLPTICSV